MAGRNPARQKIAGDARDARRIAGETEEEEEREVMLV